MFARVPLFVIVLAMTGMIDSSAFGQLITAHRGASHDAPENTLAAFRLAWEQGADAIEADFQLTGDGQIVCIHDADTKRVTGVNRVVAQTPLAALRTLDVGRWKAPSFAGERMPTLSEVLATVPVGKRLFIELKTGPEIVPKLGEVIAAGGPDPRFLTIIAFDAETVAACKKALPAIKAHWLTSFKQANASGDWRPTADEIAATVRACGADGVGMKGNRQIVNRDFIDRLTSGGVGEFHVWTVDAPDDARVFRDLGATGITTNRPAVIRAALMEPHVNDDVTVPWGRIIPAKKSLGRARMVVENRPADGRLPLPRMFPQIVQATLQGPEPQDVPIEIGEEAEEIALLLPLVAKLPAVIAVELADETMQFDDGRIVLTARDARVDGKRAKLETQPGNHRIGFWSDPDDTVAWTWRATRWGKYDARLTFSNAAAAGTTIEVTIGDEKLAVALPSTGSWYRYATLPLGRVYLPRAGDVPVTVRCTSLVGGAVMNLKAISLEPACEGGLPVQAADGTVMLHGRDATVLGTMLRYEPADAKQTLGFWTRPTDAAAWTFTVTQPGTFDVEVLQGCGKGQGGSEMNVVFDASPVRAGTPLAFTVDDTGGFQQFRPRVIGRVELAAGVHTLRISAARIAKAAACDIRQVRLLPHASGDTSDD